MLTHDEIDQLRGLMREEIEAEGKVMRREISITSTRTQADLARIADRIKSVDIAVTNIDRNLDQAQEDIAAILTTVIRAPQRARAASDPHRGAAALLNISMGRHGRARDHSPDADAGRNRRRSREPLSEESNRIIHIHAAPQLAHPLLHTRKQSHQCHFPNRLAFNLPSSCDERSSGPITPAYPPPRLLYRSLRCGTASLMM